MYDVTIYPVDLVLETEGDSLGILKNFVMLINLFLRLLRGVRRSSGSNIMVLEDTMRQVAMLFTFDRFKLDLHD